MDALGNPTSFALTPGQAHDLEGADLLLPAIQADTVIADKAYDADERVIRPLQQAGKAFVIAPRSNRQNPREYDRELYQARHLIENFFARLKQFRGIATPLRQNGPQLPCGHLSRRLPHLAQLMTGPNRPHNFVSIF